MPPLVPRDNHINKVVWAIELVQTDLQQLTEGDWLNLKQEVFEFLTTEPVWSFGIKTKILSNEDIIKLGQLIGDARTKLDPLERERIHKLIAEEEDQLKAIALADRNQKKWSRLVTVEDGHRIQKHLREMLHWMQTEDYGNFIEFDFPPSTDWLSDTVGARLQLYLVAAEIDKSQIRTCRECKRIFLLKIKARDNKVYYCTHRCAQIVASRAYRERNKGALRPKERARKRRSYVEKQQRKYGPNVKVARRPRKKHLG